MTTTTSQDVAVGDTWTLLYTAGGTVTLFVQNASPDAEMLIRIGSSTATSDNPQAAAESLYPREGRSISLANGDKVHARVRGSMAGKAILRV